MKTAFLFLFIGLLAIACNTKNASPSHQEELPDALQEKKTKAISYTRKSADLVEDLYQELIDQHPELQTLETDIEKLEKEKAQAGDTYSNYDEKNKDYYNSANHRLNNIKDTLLKNSIELLLKKSQYGYTAKKANLDKTLSTLNAQSVNLQDHHEALKIILTMALIEKYQTQQLPAYSSYKKTLDNYQHTLKTADSLLESH